MNDDSHPEWLADVEQVLGRPISQAEIIMATRMNQFGSTAATIAAVLDEPTPAPEPEQTYRYEPDGRTARRIP